ncbi:hypothetical protein ABS71_20640 [bacterium SCN 62-11]|nr:hypothetical protein [Candidatus Eremiobacteraeota bacterium]ODT57131.1 MAG: hypothetical protein ABS71_20640 [bacterium SCN 62-11]
MLRLMRTLGFFAVLVAVLASPRQGILILSGLIASYLILTVAVAFAAQKLISRHPAWSIRLTRWLGFLTGSQDYRITLLAIHKDNPSEADRIWQEVEGLVRMNPNQAMALAANYTAALSFRGDYRRARDLLLSYKPAGRARPYSPFYALYWLNLAWFHYQLEDFQAFSDCLDRAQQETITHSLVSERLAGLRALLAYEREDRDEALRLLDSDQKSAFAAWLLAELGDAQKAASRLPEAVGLTDPCDLTYYHLAQATLTGEPEHLQRAAATTYAPGHVAYHALKHFQDPSYLATAQTQDPESIFTSRAAAASDRRERGENGKGERA